MAERKLTAEEKAAADAAEPGTATTQTQSATNTGGKVLLAPPPFTKEFRVGDTVLPAEGVEVDAAAAKELHQAAKNSGITLREL